MNGNDFSGRGIDSLLKAHPGLRLAPSPGDSIRIVGRLRFTASAHGFETIEDNYELAMSVPAAFPGKVPLVWETGGRIPFDWHRNPDKTLCLGSPTAVMLITVKSETIDRFVEALVVPYLYQRSYFERYQVFPFGELGHGLKGVLQDFMDRFGVSDESASEAMVFRASLRRRVANKRPCPCGSGETLGRCQHHWKVNELRRTLGRPWFRNQVRQIEEWRRREAGSP